MENKKYNIHFRVNENDKKRIDIVLNDINKHTNKKVGYRFLIMEFVNNYLDNNLTGLKLEKNQLLKEIEKDNETKNKIVQQIQEKEIKLKAIDNELNNKSLLDISNYKYNKPLTTAFYRLKEIVLKDKIKSFDLIENDLINLANTFKVKEKDLLKEVVLYHFNDWQNEILLNQNDQPKTTKEDFIKNISNRILRRFEDRRQTINNLTDYLNQDRTQTLIKNMLKDNEYNLIVKDIINYMLENVKNQTK